MSMEISSSLKFFLNLAKVQAVVSRRFDGGLGGVSLNEFMILFQLSQAEDGKLRRVDLAEKIGLTASGVTRMLVPMEKIGLVKREMNDRDARVRYVAIAPGGKRVMKESLDRAEILSDDIITSSKIKKIEELSKILIELGGSVK